MASNSPFFAVIAAVLIVTVAGIAVFTFVNSDSGSSYYITCSETEHGTISAPSSAHAGSTVTVTIEADDGYTLKYGTLKVYKNGNANTTVAIHGDTFTMPSFNVTITAEFRMIDDGLDPDGCNIFYVLDGGTLSEDSPSGYEKGKNTELGYATKTYIDESGEEKDCVFLGWYLEPEFETNVLYIPSYMKGDVRLYASWSEDGSGAQEFFDIDTEVTKSTFFGKRTTTTTGTYSRTYLTYDEEKGSYLELISTSNTDSLGNTNRSTFTRWQTFIDTEEGSDEEMSDDVLNIDGRTIKCQSISFRYSYGNYNVVEKRYFIYGWAMLYSVAEYTSKTSKDTVKETYTLKSLGTYKQSDTYTIRAYGDEGVTTSTADGNWEFDAFTENITLTATVDKSHTFKGWFDESGELLSTDTTYTVDLLASNITLYACNTEEYDERIGVGQSYEFNSGLEDAEWSIYDSNNRPVSLPSDDDFTIKFDTMGSYIVMCSGTDGSGKIVYRFFGLMVDGQKSVTYEWQYNKVQYSYTLNIWNSDYLAYKNDDSVSRSASYLSSYTTQTTQKLITSKDKYVVELASMIVEKTEGLSEYDRINVLLAFTQYIEYKYDSDSVGQAEYWKYPVETLYENNGDCEDTSILFAAIGKAMKYDTAVMLFEGHATGAINYRELKLADNEYSISKTNYGSMFFPSYVHYITYKNMSQYLYVYNNQGYLYCETTTPNNGSGLNFTVGIDPYYGSKISPVNQTYSPYNMEQLIPAL